MPLLFFTAPPTGPSVPSHLVGEGQGGGCPTTRSIDLDKNRSRRTSLHRRARPSALRGGVGGGGPHGQCRPEPPPALALPHKGGGNAACGGRELGSQLSSISTAEAIPA